MSDRIIIGPNIYLNRIQESDAERLQILADYPGMRKNIGDSFPSPYTLEDSHSFIKYAQETFDKQNKETNYGIYIDRLYAGNLGFEQKEKGRGKSNYHLGYRLGKEYRGKGYMSRIIAELTKRMFAHLSHCHHIYGKVFARNPGSRKVLEKNGFTLEGTLREAVQREGVFDDERILAKLATDK